MSDVFPQTGEQFGRYRIDRQIGFGGMGVVYAATDTTFGRSVALKVISARLAGSDEFRRRFHREAAILARLDSPHVITIFDHAEHDGTPYISTQLIGGGDVGELLRRGGPLPAAVACRIAAQVADALHDAHRAGVVHRDVKPGNVLLRDGDLANPHAYLCDFGIAKADSAGFTLTGSVSGTWAYLAPERGHGGPGTPSSDIYALGCLLWAMLVGTTPYVGSDLEVALAHQQAPVPQLAGHDTFTAGLNAVLARSMAKDPTQRYPTAAAMRGDLARLGPPSAQVSPATAVTTAGGLSSLPSNRPQTRTGAGTSSSTAPARRNRRRGTAVAGVLALIIAASGVTWALSTTPWRDQGRTTDQSVRDADAPPRASGGAPGTSDFDGDGLGDVLASYWSPTDESGVEPTTQLFLHHSDGTKLDMEPTRAGASDSSSRLPTLGPGGQLLVGNFDDDPQAEPYLVRESAERNGIIEFIPANDSGVEFALRLPADTFFLGAHAGDFTGDGATDIALAYGGTSGDFRMHDGAGKIAVWTNLDLDREDDPPHFMPPEDGSGAPDVWLSAESWSSGAVSGSGGDNFIVGDYDGDGRDDLARVTRGDWDESKKGTKTDSTVQLLISDAATFRVVGKPRKVADAGVGLARSGDFDGDGQDELAFAPGETDGPVMRVLRASDTGWSAAKAWGQNPGNRDDQLSFKYPGVRGASVGDFNGDGKDDVAVLYALFGATDGPDAVTAAIYVWISQGERFAVPTSWVDVEGLSPGDVGTRQSVQE